jgi:hypothetical protein
VAKLLRKFTPECIWRHEAIDRLAVCYGASRAEQLLREKLAAGKMPWGYHGKEGQIGAVSDDEFWGQDLRSEENSAWTPPVKHKFFEENPAWATWAPSRFPITKYDGIFLLRAYVLELLPEGARPPRQVNKKAKKPRTRPSRGGRDEPVVPEAPMTPKAWFDDAREARPRRQDENQAEYEGVLHERMKKALGERAWKPTTIHRRFYK